MCIKKTTSQQKGKLLTVVLILFLMLFASLSERVYGISAVVQSYEESTYIKIENGNFELVRCKIHISIETEPDGTWRYDSEYDGLVEIVLDWYNVSLCPYGISLIIHAPDMAYISPFVSQSTNREDVEPYRVNATLNVIRRYAKFEFFFYTKSESDFQHYLKKSVTIYPEMEYTVYNGTYYREEDKICTEYWELPHFWITITADPQQRLQVRIETLEKQLDSLSNLLNNVIMLFVISIGVYVATSVYFATRRRKLKLN
jgi:hypothetical protein